MITINGSLIVYSHITTADILVYIGTILIAMEFIRKFTKIQALMGMIIGWPLSGFLKDKGIPNLMSAYKTHKVNIALRMALSMILAIITLPLTISFYIIWFMVLCLNSFHNLINKLYFEGQNRYKDFLSMIIGINLFAHRINNNEKYSKLNETMVIEELKKGDIPIIPIIGIILIIISFIMQLL
jgi:hypothetical protein